MAKIILLLFDVIAICIMAAWYLVQKFLEQPVYKIVQTDGNIELGDYNSILLQSVKGSGQKYDAFARRVQATCSLYRRKRWENLDYSASHTEFRR